MSEREQFGQHLKVRQTTACEGPVGSTALAMLCLPVSTPTPPPPPPHTHTHTHTDPALFHVSWSFQCQS